MSNITFAIFTKNEEKRIGYVIRNFIKYGEVLIFDDASTDKTAEAVRAAGGQYIVRPKTRGDYSFAESLEVSDFVKTHVKTDWIYWGFADSLAPKNLMEKLVKISLQDKIKMVLVPIYTYLWGNTRHFANKGYSPMFFHKDFVDFSGNRVHGMGNFIGRRDQCLKLPNKKEYALHHFSAYNMSKFINSHWRYAEEEALAKHKAGKKFSAIKMLASMARYWWIYRRSFKNGVLGLIVVLSNSFFRLMAYVKLYELENGITLESIEKNYNVLKEKMLDDFK